MKKCMFNAELCLVSCVFFKHVWINVALQIHQDTVDKWKKKYILDTWCFFFAVTLKNMLYLIVRLRILFVWLDFVSIVSCFHSSQRSFVSWPNYPNYCCDFIDLFSAVILQGCLIVDKFRNRRCVMTILGKQRFLSTSNQ